MELFKIGSTDFTTNIVAPEFTINREPDYDSYEDCDYVTHKYIKRKKVSGSFSLKFYSMDDFEMENTVIHGYRTFVNTVKDNTNSDGSIELTLYLNNELIQYTGKFDMEYTAKNSIPLYSVKDTEKIKVSIEER